MTETEKLIFNAESITDVWISDIDYSDYPDFSKAFLQSCLIDGVEATEEQLDWINDNEPEFVYKCLMAQLY